MLSTIRSSNSMSGYSLATSRLTSRNRPSVYLRMLALWTDVTFLRPCFRAYSKAYLTIRRVPVIEIALIVMPESGRTVLPFKSLDVGDQLGGLGLALLELAAEVEALGVLADDHQVDRRAAKKVRTPW